MASGTDTTKPVAFVVGDRREGAARGRFDPAALLARAALPEAKDRLKAVTRDAVARVFGALTVFAGSDMYWGQDRPDFVKEALEQQA